MQAVRLCVFIIWCVMASFAWAQNAKPMENQDVIRLTRAGLSEDLIITKIKSSTTKFDTSTEALVQLRQAGVKDRVLAVMLEGEASTQKAAPEGRTQNSPASIKYPDEVGVYAKQGGAWKELPAEKAEWKTGGVLKALGRGVVIGTSGADVDVYVSGSTSAYTVEREAEFLLRLSEGEAASAYQLVKLTQKKDRREFKTGHSGFIGYKAGLGKAQIPFEAKKISAGVFLIQLTLDIGEYGFFRNGAELFTFKVSPPS